MAFSKVEILKRLLNQINQRRHIIGVAVGAGISAKYAEKGGADLLLALNSGRFRQMGVGSLAGLLPFANSNQMVMDFGSKEIIPVVKNTPVIFGLCATDPTIDLERFIDKIIENGFSGINNYPSVGIIGGVLREALEEEGMSFQREVEAISIASKKGLFTIAFVFNAEQAQMMVEAGADVITSHLGFTVGGQMDITSPLNLKEAAQLTRDIFAQCDKTDRPIIKMIYGGPIHQSIDLKYMYDNSGAMGYFGGSTFERIPLEKAIVEVTREFKITGQFDQDSALFNLADEMDYVYFIKDYIAKNYMNKISFNDLAMRVHLSRTYLSAMFNREVGVTFPEYLTQVRINKAIEIMRNKNINKTEIATLVGFSDYAYFSKIFKKHTGYSPSEYDDIDKNT
jgi:predicted TIM-barrel enzyme/AraC-like DNA-binding protein